MSQAPLVLALQSLSKKTYGLDHACIITCILTCNLDHCLLQKQITNQSRWAICARDPIKRALPPSLKQQGILPSFLPTHKLTT